MTKTGWLAFGTTLKQTCKCTRKKYSPAGTTAAVLPPFLCLCFTVVRCSFCTARRAVSFATTTPRYKCTSSVSDGFPNHSKRENPQTTCITASCRRICLAPLINMSTHNCSEFADLLLSPPEIKTQPWKPTNLQLLVVFTGGRLSPLKHCRSSNKAGAMSISKVYY